MNKQESSSITKANTLHNAVETLTRAVGRLEKFVEDVNGESNPSEVKENEPSPSLSLSYVLAVIPTEINKLADRLFAAEESLRKSLI